MRVSCLGLALWAMLVPFRLLFTTWGIKKRGRKLFVVLLLFVGLDVPERWMQTVERYERAKGGEAGERRIGFRWNGTKENKIGSPQSRGLPTWMILDEKLYEAVIDILPSDKQDIAKMFLRL